MVLAFQIAESILQVTGDDRKSYLQGQVTQDLNLLDDTQFLWSGHCNAKGKLWSAHKLIATEDSFMLVCGDDEAQQSLVELKKYGVFSKVNIEITEKLITLGLQAESTESIESLLSISFAQGNLTLLKQGYAIKLAEGLVQLVVEPNMLDTLSEHVSFNTDESEWLAALIKAGLPRLNRQTFDEFVPQMVNLQAIGGISFTKGCYTGQETVARMKYLGKNKRAMFCLKGNIQFNHDAAKTAEHIEMKIGENWRRGGKVMNIACTNEEVLVQTVLPNDTDPEAILRFKDNEISQLTLSPLPYSLED